jgi:hypothetical protein
MNVLSRRPDRPLPPGRHEELRADLLDAIETDQARTPRRHFAPVAAAAAVLAVAAGVATAVPALTHDDGAAPATGKIPAPPVIRELSAADTATLRTECLAEANRITSKNLKRPFVQYKIVRAFEFVDVKNPKIVKTWLMGEGREFPRAPKGFRVEPAEGYWFCSRTAGGTISESSLRFPSSGAVLDAPVFGMARNAGIYTSLVARVTVQPEGEAPVEAVLQDGFWFAPTAGRTNWGPYDADDPERPDYVVRAYDAAGQQVYTSDQPTRTVTCPMVEMPTVTAGQTFTRPTSTSSDPACRQYYWPS